MQCKVLGTTHRAEGPARSPSSGVRSQEAERRHSESTGAGEEGEQQRLLGSTGLRAGDNRVATNQPGGSRGTLLPPLGLVPREQPPLPPLPRETTEYITAGGKEEATNSLILRDGREA